MREQPIFPQNASNSRLVREFICVCAPHSQILFVPLRQHQEQKPSGLLTNRALGCHGGQGTMRKIIV